MTDRTRAKGLRSADFGLMCHRGEITAYHRDFARSRRPAVSWQNIAHMLGVNQTTLRRAVEGSSDRPAVSDVAPARAAPAGPKVTQALAILRLLDDGRAAEIAEVTRELGAAYNSIGSVMTTLRSRGFLHQPAPRGPYLITPAGRAELAFRESGGRNG